MKSLNVKTRIAVMLLFCFCFSLVYVPPLQAATITQNQVDLGFFTCWLHSDGATWQSIPGYGVKKPGDSVTFTYSLTYDGPAADKVVGVKGASYYTGDQSVYNTTHRKEWQSYSEYMRQFDNYIVTNMSDVRAVYKGNRQVQITVTVDLKTKIQGGNPPRWGEVIKEPWQAQLTDGRKFYSPVLVEWEIEGQGPDFYPTPQGQSVYKESYKTLADTVSGRPGQTINVPATLWLKGSGSSTKVEATWYGSGWNTPVFSRDYTVSANGSTSLSIPVVVPKQGEENRLVIVCNRTGTGPSNEVNKNNNMMVVRITPDGQVDKQEYLTVVPSSSTLFVGSKKQFKSYYHKSDGTSTEVTSGSSWSVSNSNIASLTVNKGELRGVKEGQVELKATYKGLEGIADVTVITEPVPPPPNYKPVADFDISNPSPVEGETIYLYDRSTHEGTRYGESITSWEWTIENVNTSSNQNTDATWDEVGTYSIRLRVEDQDGDSDSRTKSVVVGPALPAAVISVTPNNIILGRDIVIDGDQSTAANGRDIKWDEMQWEFTKPDGAMVTNGDRYPVPDKAAAASLIDQTGLWKVRLKVKDTKDNESEWAESYFTVFPDLPPIADFWLTSESLRYSYEEYSLTVHDLSSPAIPDGSLGDEICERIWTLYYDANNDGNAKGAGDQVIRSGDTGKAAQIIQTSINDSKPVVRFNKTGRYQLELTVKERYEAWGETTEGLSANTEDKAIEEKQLIVINLAPTVAFDIKKKTPADILFAADYSVSDSKYNSLQSGQAGFVNELEGGFVESEIGIEKVKLGDVSNFYITEELFSLGDGFWTPPGWLTNFRQELNSFYRFEEVMNYGGGIVTRGEKMLNISTGEQKAPSTIVKSLNNGTYYRGYFGTGYLDNGQLLGFDKVDANMNVVSSRAFYDNVINNFVPKSTPTWNYTRKLGGLYFGTDGSFYIHYEGNEIINGNNSNHYTQHIIKVNSNLTKAWDFKIADYNIYTDDRVSMSYVGQFSDTNNLAFVLKKCSGRSVTDTLISVGTNGVYNLSSENYSSDLIWNTDVRYAMSANEKYLMAATFKKLQTYNSTSIVNTINFTSFRKGDGPDYFFNFNGNDYIFYQDYYWTDGGPETIYLYEINNNGVIRLVKEFTEFWPGDYPGLEWSSSGVSVKVAGEYIAVTLNHSGNSSDRLCYSLLDKNFNTLLTKGPLDNRDRGRYIHNPIEINSNLIGYQFDFVPYSDYSASFPATKEGNVYRANGSLFLSANSLLSFGDGSFIAFNSSRANYYNAAGNLTWGKNVNEGDSFSSTKFYGNLILSTKENNKPVTKIINSLNGSELAVIPYELFGSTDEIILCYHTNSSGSRNGSLIGFGQLQGLEYLRQIIESHPWDINKFNVIASVIDANAFIDFDAQRDIIQSLLEANNLRLSVISPSASSTRSQAMQIITDNPYGGWWIQTENNMAAPLSTLAQKIIAAVNEDKGADNIVLVGQEAVLKANYADMEDDAAAKMVWSFSHDREKLGSLPLVSAAALSALHNTSQTVTLDSNSSNQLDITFDRAGTYKVYCKAQDYPVTTPEYLPHEKAGQQWSNQDAYISVIAHHKPIANFTINSGSIYKNTPLNITDNSYDPDLYNPATKATTDPQGLKGLRVWEWQYKKPAGVWEKHITNDNTPPNIYINSGAYEVRLRVQDNFGAWSDWSKSEAFNVINRPPVADFNVSPNPAAVANRSMITDNSYDPDGDKITEWKWEIEKGLGVVETITRTSAAPFPYVWNTEGIFNVKLTVKDIEGATGTITKPVTVILNNPPIAIITVPDDIYTGEWFTADGTDSYDPDGDVLIRAYWQYKKPDDTNWSNVYIQERSGPFVIPGESYLNYPLFPLDGEHGTWWLRLIVEDDKGLLSLPAEVSFAIQEGFEVSGYVVPDPGERGRDMIVTAFAHRKDNPDDKIEITDMKAYIIHPTKPDGSPSMASGHSPEIVNMVFDAAATAYKYTFRVPEKIQDSRWPDDGSYYIKVVGTKGDTEKEALLPVNIKGHIQQRLYTKTRSW